MNKLLQQIATDTKYRQILGKSPDGCDVDNSSVQLSWRNLGRWIHDEERGREQEAEGDSDWREDDDNMILAPGEYKRITEEVNKRYEGYYWWSLVTISIDSGEKCWISVLIIPKPEK